MQVFVTLDGTFQTQVTKPWISWVIPVYKTLFGGILGQPLASQVIQFSGGQWRF